MDHSREEKVFQMRKINAKSKVLLDESESSQIQQSHFSCGDWEGNFVFLMPRTRLTASDTCKLTNRSRETLDFMACSGQISVLA